MTHSQGPVNGTIPGGKYGGGPRSSVASPGETSCLSDGLAIMDLVIAGGKGLGLSLAERHAIAAMISRAVDPQTGQQVA